MYTLLHRSFTIASDFSKFYFEVETLKKTLHKNAYPTKFVDKFLTKFVNNVFIQKPVVTTVPKLKLRIMLPYLGNISSITKKRLNRCIGKRLKLSKLKIVFQTRNRLKSYFRFKDRVPETLQSTLPINVSVETAQLPATVKRTDILRFGLQNIRVILLEQVNESKVRYPSQ